ncbi:RNA polymerase sigma factor [Solirubrobacter soli]|uniref:RNA polymerase sigma factor n=1 Tax=Solirubrobacter soli TaxID=363832 RepID=UPI0003FA1B61|nr:sigma-70 family RNA polymerase sigma factor [Solirubrobacter soli]
MSPPDRFEAMYRAHYGAVLAYTRRRTSPADAEEVAAEVFTVALRRHSELRDPVLPWLLVVARNALANRARSRERALAKTEAAAHVTAHHAPDHAELLGERDALLRALATLSEDDQEALRLVAWDDLPLDQAARVAGVSAPAFRMRLTRARRRLAAALTPVETT